VRQNVVAREKEEFGGFKFGSAFFGWLTATGTVVLLTALVAGAGAALGLGTETTSDDVTDVAQANAETIGIIGAVAVLVILLVAYYCGGYVAGRMARFSGAKQGLAVWLWAIVIAIVVAIIGAIAGSQYNVLSNLDTFPRIPIGEGDLTAAGIITAVLALVVSLGGAILGGLAGMRYHRKVDRAGLGK
jgi:heme/copper-type cytochrome/quinol oxidase subunit 2